MVSFEQAWLIGVTAASVSWCTASMILARALPASSMPDLYNRPYLLLKWVWQFAFGSALWSSLVILRLIRQSMMFSQAKRPVDSKPLWVAFAALVSPAVLLALAAVLFSQPTLFIDESYWLISADSWLPWLLAKYLLSFSYVAILAFMIRSLWVPMQRTLPQGRTKYALTMLALAFIDTLVNFGSDSTSWRMTLHNRRICAFVDMAVLAVFAAINSSLVVTSISSNKEAK